MLFALRGVLGQLAARARATGEESERWFSMATDLLATSSLEGCFTHLNPARERTLGWTSAELMSRPYICALGCGCGTRSRTSAASGSNASRRSSITTGVHTGGI